jgi:tripartite-type tricarboxylate transporter receptor subunit TctC
MKRAAGFSLIAALALPACAAAAEQAGDYPTKPIRVIVGITPGGGLDAMTRVGAQKLSERWNQSVIVDNRPGGGTLVAMDLVARAAPDGYTLLAASDTFILNGVLKRVSYDVRKTFVPIVQLTSQPYMMVMTPSLPIRTVKELVAYARARPGVLSYGSQGLGTMGHIGMERFDVMTGISMVHVPYKGAGPAMIDVMSGGIQLMFASTVSSTPHIKSGKLKALGVTGARRLQGFPELPAVSESVPGFELYNSYSYYAPAGTPRGIVSAINSIIAQGMNTPEMAKYLAVDGSEAVPPATPEAFRARVDREYAEMEKVIRVSKIRFE